VQFHEQYRLDPPFIDPLQLHSSTTTEDMIRTENDIDHPISKNDFLIQYERLLEEYYALFVDSDLEQQRTVPSNDDIFDMDASNDNYYYDTDDGYEADLHVSIGTLYMELHTTPSSSSSTISQATNHFEQAVRLYQASGEVHSTNMALAKYNLFLLHLRDGDYRTASLRYNDAVDALRTIDVTTEHPDSSIFIIEMMTVWKQGYRNVRKQQPYKSTQRHNDPKESQSSINAETSTRDYKIVKSTKDSSNTGSSLYVDVQHFLSQNYTSRDEL
jgi:hypothetical protein